MKKWKVLFWLIAFFTFLDFIGLPFQSSVGFGDLIGLFIGAMMLVPYYGYSYQVAVGNKLLWQAVFALLIVVNISVVVLFIYSEVINVLTGGEVWLVGITVLTIGLLLMVLLSIPPYRYAFRSQQLWAKNA